MNIRLLKGAVIALLTFAFLTPVFGGEIDDQLANARKNGLPVLLEFGASWCIPCQLMQPAMNKVEQEYRGRLAVVIVDVDSYRDFIRKFAIRITPTLVFLDRNGDEFKRLFGGSSYEEITAVLKTQGL